MEAKTTNENKLSPSTRGINLSFGIISPFSSLSLRRVSTLTKSPEARSYCF